MIRKTSYSKKLVFKLIAYYFNKYIGMLEWSDLEPWNVRDLYKKYPDRIMLEDFETSRKGCTYISWLDHSKLNISKWILPNEEQASEKAKQIFDTAHFVLTWRIYKQTVWPGREVEKAIDNPCSIFHHLIKMSKEDSST